MDIKTNLIATAERLFDRNGFSATGMDRLTQEAGLSSRTLYKHVGSKTALMALVLGARERRFMERLNVQSVDEIFDVLAQWTRDEGGRGCLFLRSYGETGGDIPEIANVVLTHKDATRAKIAEIVQRDLGAGDHGELTEQILVLFEGAVAAAVYRGMDAISAARKAAAILVAQARS
ncbi:MAG: TetR family transcriptional regulator [Thalassospira sp.]|uniref:TetR/AcrR family transcriptional regulator n=1 Tax=Thalassospira sp. TaxID=1912094 RepID=UPI000C6B5345|nr:TetR/AcrR family transcriptional regulator [Thalassospira sp.]MAZ35443.1 TetR family transcriptional regulator [Thalassospira sp.]|tara:strand:- start:297 stop:824 length:528 start_codon:yes stop_codon:yes gene_type:complete